MSDNQLGLSTCQVPNDTPSIRAVIKKLCQSFGHGGTHRPAVLQMEPENRVEFLHILQEVRDEKRTGILPLLMDPSELRRVLRNHPDSCFYGPGDELPHDTQKRLVDKYTHKVRSLLTPPIFCIVTCRHPDKLRELEVWRADFHALFRGKTVIVPTAAERRPPELVRLFENAVRLAVRRANKSDFHIERGALDLLRVEWGHRPPPSLEFVVRAADKIVALADGNLKKLAREAAELVAQEHPLRITSKDVVNALMPDSPLADRAVEGTPIY